MSELTLQSNKANLYSNIIRVILGTIGLIYLASGSTELLPEWSIEIMTIINIILGSALIIVALTKSTIGANIEISLTEQFLQTTEDTCLTRTAYWNKLDKLVLTRFSIRITYRSGAKERFRLPFVTNDDFKKLHKRFADESNTHGFRFEEKPWWKLF